MKNKMILVLFGLVLTTSSLTLLAQERILGGPQKQKIETVKIAFFSRQMHLTPEEAKVFWPLYDEYQIVMDAQKRNRRQQLEEIREGSEKMNDDQINAIIDGRLEQAENALNARKQFIQAIRKELPPKKVLAYFRAEEQFQRELAERAAKLKKEKQDRMN
jgi:hypothetical protein